MSLLSEVTYRIQRSRRAKPKVIHTDRLKPYPEPALRSWISKGEETSEPVVSRAGCAVVLERVMHMRRCYLAPCKELNRKRQIAAVITVTTGSGATGLSVVNTVMCYPR